MHYGVLKPYLVKEDGSLSQHMPSLDELLHPITQDLVTFVHLGQARFMLRELHVQFINGLSSSRPNSDERCRVIQRSYGDRFLLLLDLIAEETDATCHFVDTPNLPDKGTLERVDIGVQLVSRVSKLLPRYSRNR